MIDYQDNRVALRGRVRCGPSSRFSGPSKSGASYRSAAPAKLGWDDHRLRATPDRVQRVGAAFKVPVFRRLLGARSAQG